MTEPTEAAPMPRWPGTVNELRSVLWHEAWRARGAWSYRILESGVMVALRVRPEDFRHEWRLARPYWTEDFRDEEAGLAKLLGCAKWDRNEEVGKPRVFYLEPEPFFEARKLTECPCHDCGMPTTYEPFYKVQRCASCAAKAGKAEAGEPAAG